MSKKRKRADQVAAILLAAIMVLSVQAVFATAVAAGPEATDETTIGETPTDDTNGDSPTDNTTGENPTSDTTIPTGETPLDTADAVLANQPGDATVARSQLGLVRDLQTIIDSRSGRTQALDLADATLEHRKQMAASRDKPLSPDMVPLFDVAQTKGEGSNTLLETEGAIAKAKKGTKLQAALADDSVTMDSDLPDIRTQNHVSPSSATMALMDRYGARATAEDVAAMQKLDDLPEPTRTALTDYLNAFLAFQRTTAQGDFTRTMAARIQLLDATADLNDALENTDGPGLATPQHSGDEFDSDNHENNNNVSIQVDADESNSGKTQIGCVEASVQRKLVDESITNPGVGSGNDFPVEGGVDVDHHFCVLQLGDSSDQTYTHNTVVLIDEGGNDKYHMNAGGTNLDDDTRDINDPFGETDKWESNHGATNVTHPMKPLAPAPGPPLGENKNFPINNSVDADVAAALVDMGSGDDNYTQKKALGWGQRGGAHLGSGFLVDQGGSDEYGDSEYGSESAADSHFGTNGGASANLAETEDCCEDFVATGFLLDMGSNTPGVNNGKDTYLAGSMGTNGGSAKGDNQVSGFILDMEGPSNYTAYSSGTNGGGASGQGFLYDGGGDDIYNAEFGGTNGGGYRTGLPCAGQFPCGPGGFLVDGGGGDTYKATSEGTNGGGTEQANGFILDDGAGTDTYKVGHSDKTGDTEFDRRSPSSFNTGPVSRQAGIQGVNGGGYENGVGVLIDTESTSNYKAGDGLGSNGGGALLGAGLIVDNGGDDLFKAGIAYTSKSTFDHPSDFVEITHPSAGSNGGGATGGVGSIVDASGSDDYYALGGQFGGVNATNGGGWALGVGAAGLAFDADGEDNYNVTVEDGPITGANGGGSGYGASNVGNVLDATYEALNSSGLCEVDGVQTCHQLPFADSVRATGTLFDNGTVDHNPPGNAKGIADDYKVVTIDTDNSDDNERVAGVNGGAFKASSTGLLVEQQGDYEEYNATAANGKTLGVNGGVNVPLSNQDGVGAAVLLDAAGTGDDYTQEQCDSTDDTWLPKGIAGAQIDSTSAADRTEWGCDTESPV